MKVKLIGYKEVDFTPKNDSPVKGIKLFVSYPQQGVVGSETRDIFVREENRELIGIDLSKWIEKMIDIDLGFQNKVVAVTGV